MTYSLRRRLISFTFVPCVLLLGSALARSADAPAEPEKREPVATVLSATGTLLAAPAKSPTNWVPLKKGAEIASSDRILALPGFRGQVGSAASSAQVTFWGNVPEFSRVPLFESEAVFHQTRGNSLDLTLLRGRLLLNVRDGKKLPASVRVRIGEQITYDIRLPDADSAVALEMYSRWPSGTPFTLNQTHRGTPHILFLATAVKGKAFLKVGDEQHLLQAPATFQWDNLTGQDARPSPVPQVPSWVKGVPATPEARRMEQAVQRLQKQLESTSVDKALAETLASNHPEDRALAVGCYAATDNLGQLAEALSDAKRTDVRTDAIAALRHWLGQTRDHDVQFYTFLRKEWKYTPEQAEIVVQLLLGFRDSDWQRPETYETLIDYLRHRKRSVRELARWHLYRWAIAGRGIPYDASASPEQAEKAYKAWKQLIPSGKLPPAPAKEPK